ncbi:50S ribosomal protein L3 N(5)-glutamine methyltransferase [uncultured Bradyrhizobium sp.]|uniref:50S ribosomal protein L3 N(5)-glutamine methyltransferase n=1 Tax=uncultured Bradyrhizobium sp. TaxID=199684 RepID=UPI0035C9C878
MVKSAKAAAKRSRPARKPVKPKPFERWTLFDFVRYAVSRFVEAELVFAHGTTDVVAEAAFLVSEALHLHPDEFEMFAAVRTTAPETEKILGLIESRIATQKPAAYLVNKAYMRGLPFYVDERVIVPRSFIGELLDSHFSEEVSLIDDPAAVKSVLDLCTGSGCLAVLASRRFPHAHIDAVDISAHALEVAARNVIDGYALEHRISLHRGDLFEPLGGRRYDLIISNPPYVDAEGMAGLPQECRFEPKLAFDGGADGLAVVRRILNQAGSHLTPQGGLLCEIGRGRERLEDAFPRLPLLWLDTEESEGEVFWIGAKDL